jgi:hypothetical protein
MDQKIVYDYLRMIKRLKYGKKELLMVTFLL